MENKTLGIVITVGVAILIGVILVQIIASNATQNTQLVQYTDTVDISPVRTMGGNINYTAAVKLYADDILSKPAGGTWKSDFSNCAITTVKYYNQSGALMSNADDYTWVEDGNGAVGSLRPKNVANLNGSGESSNLTTIVYNSCPDTYLTQSWSRTILNMVPGFFALAILLGAAFVIFFILRKEGITFNI